jgi:hypothetical protein
MIPAPPIVDFVEDEDIIESIKQDFIEYLYSFNFLAEKEPDEPSSPT